MYKYKSLVALLFTLILVTSCRNTSTSQEIVEEAPEQVVINVMHRWPIEPERELMGNLLNDMFREFESQNPDIKIKVDSVPSSMYESQLTVRLASEEGPDVYIYWPGGRTESQIRKDDILDITHVWDENMLFDKFKEGVIQGSTHTDGRMYTLPIESKPNTFWYNKSIYNELGLVEPESWDQLMNHAKIIKEAGYIPFAVSGNLTRWMTAFWFDYILLNTSGGEFRERLMWGEESWESEQVFNTFEIWKEMVDAGYFNSSINSADSKEVTAMVANGEAAMMLQGPWAISEMALLGLEPGEDFDLFPFPVINEELKPAAEGAILAWAINPSSSVIPATERLMAYMAQYESSKFLSSKRITLGARKDIGMEIYDEKTRPLMEGLNDVLNESPLYMTFDLATLPPIQDAGMDAFIEFLNNPEDYKDICARLEEVSRATID